MSVNEELTLKLICQDLQLMEEVCQQAEGKVLKSTGDGLLMSFVSAVQAVTCALKIQKRLAERQAIDLSEQPLEHRIGIHLGDVFFSQSDVMGNGVNIAARLQHQAEPGGICISQTIYDVVKVPLSLQASFVGPLQLKNIRQAISVYQIAPYARRRPQCEDLTEATPLNFDTPLDATVQALKQHANSRRIKKLLFGTCQNGWENDPAILAKFELKELLQTLLDRYPTLDALKQAISRTVSGLNRQQIYGAVADIIVTQVEPLYPSPVTATGLVMNEATQLEAGSPASSYQAIAQIIEQSLHRLRLTKLLYCIGHDVWENNSQTLSQLNLVDLVEQVHQLTPTPKDLKYRLSRIVRQLNRQAEYRPVANTLIKAFHPLYAQSQLDPTSLGAFTRCSEQAKAAATRLEPFANSAVGGATQAHYSGLRVAQSEVDSAVEVASGPQDRSNLFPLRLEILKYTNPLRAKILLLSCVYGPFSFTEPEWRSLRTKTLEDLLKETFDYCQTFADLESRLTILAHCLDSTDENVQVAGAIARVMKPYYPV
ncbi:MAG: adenylate/guanylate cyclase domain-containing protein [Almyronema sp.]